jgi:flagellar basal-body rod protein FlgG
MLAGLYSAAAGMAAQETAIDAIGNDLANVSTTGYKSERVGFSDLLYSEVREAGTATSTGAGALARIVGRDHGQGALRETGEPLDLAIEGEGFLQVKRPGGQLALTRDGALHVDASGQLTSADGSLLNPPIALPAGTSPSAVRIAADGTVRVGARTLGRIEVVEVPAPDQLLADGEGAFTATAASGAPQPAKGATVRQGALESSNVDVATEMTQMVSTQRDYQLASTAIQTQSQMMSIANQLRA